MHANFKTRKSKQEKTREGGSNVLIKNSKMFLSEKTESISGGIFAHYNIEL